MGSINPITTTTEQKESFLEAFQETLPWPLDPFQREAIEKLETQPATDLAGSLRDLFQRLTRRGVLLIASDFLVDDLEQVFGLRR